MNIYKSYQNILIDYGLRMTHELLHCLTSIPFRKKKKGLGPRLFTEK
jgi:hypothetical protein